MTELLSTRDPTQNESSIYSAGTAIAVDGLERFLLTGRRPPPDMLAINVGTLLRNRLGYNNDLRISEILKLQRAELHLLIEDIGHMLTRNRVGTSSILLYLYDYSKSIPADVARPNEASKSRKQLQAATIAAIREYKSLFGMINSIPGMDIRFDIYQQVQLPHRHLATLVRQMSKQRKLMMLSHVAIDYHVAAKASIVDFYLLESHTGAVKSLAEIGPKVFGKPNLPFNKYTHALMGDKDYIKSPLSNKERKLLLEMAATRRWESKTASVIKADINKLGFPIVVAFD